MKTLGITQSVCPTCRRTVPAKVLGDETGVHFESFCPDHGPRRRLVHRDMDAYLRSQHFVKPAWVPRSFAGDSAAPCPEGCGFCDRHEQHLCMPIIEITQRCDLACPICLVDAGGGRDMSRDEFRLILNRLIEAEGQIAVLNLSGGEPLLHPDLLALVDDVLSRPEFVRVSISTNGLRLLAEPQLVDELASRDVVVSLQFDGFSDHVYTTLRGRPLLAQKRRILDLMAERRAPLSLTVTAAGGVNEDQFGPILEYYFAQPHIVSMMIQPIAFAGRAAGWRGDSLASANGKSGRLTIPDVLHLLDQAGNPRVSSADFAPLPCCHPLCFSLAHYLMLEDGNSVSLSELVGTSRLMDSLANRTIFGLDEEETESLKDLVYELWSGPRALAPDGESIMRTLRRILDELTCSCMAFDPRKTFGIAQRRIKSIFIHAFQDADTFDLARVRRCCTAYPLADGRLMPACVYNVRERQVIPSLAHASGQRHTGPKRERGMVNYYPPLAQESPGGQ